ncbi:hypothetical protein COCON_G00183770 [Conger conger]|uniref:ITPR-interacting domain-containing protein n=1 Tax=Conger conger TaxID=82655 RepID=A0A9Q1D5S4_CONCO|nr:hypothetical protein COCON_G00183770 [Conger conger]
MERQSRTDRRQAWVRSSRHRLTLEDSDPQESGVPTTLSDTLPDDDVFLEGCCAGKIESWLQGCGPGQGSEDPGHVTVESLVKAISSFEDDLSLGAEATVLHIGDHGPHMGTSPRLLPPPRVRQSTLYTSLQQKLSIPFVSLGHSMASSGLSSETSKTASSVSEVLQLCAEDAEEILFQLGFGCDQPHVPARIPARFFSFPSKLRGINFRLFLESQLRRLRDEDPGLSLASRFRQVEVLTAMANAFYSLYSHVSRTPLQKLAPPEPGSALSPAEMRVGPRFFSSVRSEPRSPVERFKDTVSKISTPGPGSDPAEPLTSCLDPCASFAPVPKISQDTICPVIRESVSLAPYRGLPQARSPVGGPRRACRGGAGAGAEQGMLLTVTLPPCRIARPAPDSGGSQNYLSPMRPPSLGQVHSPSDQQANSFELEEVHSAGEDDAGLTDGQTVMAPAPLSAVKRHRDVILREDSVQSDSSGYADEDYNPSSP